MQGDGEDGLRHGGRKACDDQQVLVWDDVAGKWEGVAFSGRSAGGEHPAKADKPHGSATAEPLA